MIAVKDLTSHRTIRMPKDRDTDKTVYRGADTMLEGIFYQRYEIRGAICNAPPESASKFTLTSTCCGKRIRIRAT